jgi:hypothetical protein
MAGVASFQFGSHVPSRGASLLLAIALCGLATPAWSQCTSDAECGKDQSCVGDGHCVRNTTAPAASASSAASSAPATLPPSIRQAENTAEACKNGLDDDHDGYVDCADQDCGLFVFCANASKGMAPPPPLDTTPSDSGASVRHEGRHRRTRGIMGLYILGPVLFGVSWATTIAMTGAVYKGAPRQEAALPYSCIPLAGPWIMLGSDLDTRGMVAPLAITGAFQATGILLTVLGVTIRRPVSDDARLDGLPLVVAPAVGRSSASLSVTRAF